MGMNAALHARRRRLLADILGRVGDEGERLPCDDHGAAEVNPVGPAEGEGFAVALAVQPDAADLPALDQLLEIAPRFDPAGQPSGQT